MVFINNFLFTKQITVCVFLHPPYICYKVIYNIAVVVIIHFLFHKRIQNASDKALAKA